jgi:transcription termination factor Rho
MFEISELKAKTLAELQDVAKSIGLSKTSQLKKLDLVYQILDSQAANPSKPVANTAPQKTVETEKKEKPKRKRVLKNPQAIERSEVLEKPQTVAQPRPIEQPVTPVTTERPKPNPRPRKRNLQLMKIKRT